MTADSPEVPIETAAAVDEAVQRLLSASATSTPCQPVRDLIGSNDLEAAYAVQTGVTQARLASGGRVVGRKIGLTARAVQEQLGVDQPDFGILFEDMAYLGGDTIPYGAVMQPRIEAEIAFVLGRDLDEDEIGYELVREAIDHAVPALEICGSRIAGWDISFGDTVADNASAGAYVLGPRHTPLAAFDPVAVEMTMTVDGEEVSTGTGAACLGDPIEAVVWLARQARGLGDPLLGGQVVLSGALGPMRPVGPGASVTATLSGLGSISVSFGR